LLARRVAGLPRFRELAVFDASGWQIASSFENVDGDDFAEPDFFRSIRSGPPGRLYVSLPYLADSDGLPAVAVATDWRGANGRLRGMIVLVADPEFLDRDFPRLAPSSDTRMAVYRHDLALVADGPGDHSREWASNTLARALWSDASAQGVHTFSVNGESLLVAARRLQHSQLMLVVARERARALASWSDEAWLVGTFAGSTLLVILLLSVRNAREQWLRAASETALAAEQSRAMRAFQAAQEGAWEWNPTTQETYLSPRMKELLGLPRDASPGIGLLARETVHPDDLEPLREAFENHRQGRTGQFDHVFRVRSPEGGWRHVHSRGLAIQGDEGVIFSGTARDVSDEVRARVEREHLEERLSRQRRLEALGTLAGGVAHDFNNILASVIGYGELAREGIPADSASQRQLDQVLRAGQRGKALVERVLAFSRGAPRTPVPFRLQPVVEEVLQMLAASLPAGVRLIRKLLAPDAVVRGDPTAVFEATMNLCSNGVQAMPSRGALTVSLEILKAEHERPVFEGRLSPGTYARLRVEDQGTGIAAEAMPRLFEPFFTTKGVGVAAARASTASERGGTGLGLAVVHRVVLDLGGAIDVHSESGRGARFDLYLPVVDEPVADQAPRGQDAIPLGNGEAVLVVDDEPALVELAEELLASLGYEPFGVTSSREALLRFRAEPERFALLLTDEVMPGMTGTALASAVHELRPTLPVVLASGFGGAQFEQCAAAARVTAVVSKPLTRADLARTLARALRA
jgi:PAS domain S-box-containing protein